MTGEMLAVAVCICLAAIVGATLAGAVLAEWIDDDGGDE